MYITAASTISYQPTFRNNGFSQLLTPLQPPYGLVSPEYNNFIPVMERRRMSDVLKMSITCSKDCLIQAGIQQPEAIIVGTGLGCLISSRNFLDKIITAEGGLISPTPFIVSTHNTIAGQISLLLKNHGYNMTHTQGSLSFEQALMDAGLCITEGKNNILVGGADELEPKLYDIESRIDTSGIPPTAGASFFILSSFEKHDGPNFFLMDADSIGLTENIAETLASFSEKNNLSSNEIDLVLYSCSEPENKNKLIDYFGIEKLLDFQKFSGIYFTNPSFALQMGMDIMLNGTHPVKGTPVKKVLICNNLIPENLGLILIELKS